MKKIIFVLLLLSLVACNKSDDNSQGGQEWSNDTVPNPEVNQQKSTENIEKNNISKSENQQITPFKKEDISGEWAVTMNITSTTCDGINVGEEINQRWFVNFESGELNIKVMDRASKIKEYWGIFTGKNISAIADKKLTKEEMLISNSRNIERNTLSLSVENSNMITGNREEISKSLCKTKYTIKMKR